MRRRVWLLLILGLLAGCPLVDVDGDRVLRIACLGDSNTVAGWPTPDTTRWCERLCKNLPSAPVLRSDGTFATLPVACYDDGWGGVTVTDQPVCHNSYYACADVQMAGALAQSADVVILAFGTNDLRDGATPAEIVAAYKRVIAPAQQTGRLTYIALTPPMYPPPADGVVEALNAALVASFDRSMLVDFYTGFTQSLFLDSIHLNDSGQDLRAARASAALLE